MRIGRQLTEAMLLKGKARQKACRSAFNSYLALLKNAMVASIAKGDSVKAASLEKMCKDFDTFEFKHIELESAYNDAFNSAQEAIANLENLVFLIEKRAMEKGKRDLNETLELAIKSISTYVVNGEDEVSLRETCARVKASLKGITRPEDYDKIVADLNTIRDICQRGVDKIAPNFFALGYYYTFSKEPLPELPVEELNKFLRKYLDDNFMLEFISNAKVALETSAESHNQAKLAAVEGLKKGVELFSTTDNFLAAEKELDHLIELVKASIDPLEIRKDSAAYTFASSTKAALEVCAKAGKNNAKESKRYEAQKRKYDAYAKRKGTEPDWKVTPAAIIDMDVARENLCRILTRLLNHYEDVLASRENRDFDGETVAVIDFLKSNASGVVAKVTRRIAKHRALKLMQEVGIPEPRKRYRQYPFEFSGGMRQRIVIAIALAANPDILICDEPTTALDVTIQAQILELINRLKKERNLSIIFITHDLGVVANMADKIAVMYAGKIVEYGTSRDVFYSPAHPYTWALLSSMPDLDTNEKLEAIPGTPPNMIYPPVGDAFADRNKYALKIDFEQQPPMFRISDTHYAATWLLHPDAPKVEPPKIVTERIARMTQLVGGKDDE
jgi:oligopeptide/dipeptide ABC transporter ATP-binding protein